MDPEVSGGKFGKFGGLGGFGDPEVSGGDLGVDSDASGGDLKVLSRYKIFYEKYYLNQLFLNYLDIQTENPKTSEILLNSALGVAIRVVGTCE